MDDYGNLFNQAVAAELRAERARTRITIESLVHTTGLSKSAVLNYLNGKRDIPTPALYDLSSALGVDARTVFDRAYESMSDVTDKSQVALAARHKSPESGDENEAMA